MIIYRAGLTGCLAACLIPDSEILDTDSAPVLHKAVLRFRSDEISKATGIPFKKIKVTKAVFDGEMFMPWSPMLANQYSMKVIDGLYDRSIENLEPVTRWLAPSDFHEQLIEMIGNRIHWNHEAYLDPTLYKENIISTLSLPINMQIVGQGDIVNLATHFNSIYVTTINVCIPCEVHQTVYFPDPSSSVYRVTLEGQKMIIESTAELEDGEYEWIPGVFGLRFDDFSMESFNYKQKIGKIAPVDDNLRKELIHLLTENHGIYSLGRTAVWKNILLDDCLQDIHRIQGMINKSKYDRMLGK